jgi:FMN phosphatase YigB (HAD superfamily)
MIKAILFDWGNTLMIDFPDQNGPMYLWDKIEAVPNADICLSNLSRDYSCYIATNAKNSTKEDIIKALKIVKIDKYIEDVFCYKEIGFEKPSKEFFDCVIDKLQLKKEEIIMVGDDYQKDYLGARNYGLSAIFYNPGNNERMQFIVNNLLDVPKAVEEICR